MLIIFFILALIFLLICAIWLLVPMFFGTPFVPTRAKRIQKALQLAGLRPNETLYDLGSGDGRVLFIAAREFGAYAVGVEIGPIQCAAAWLGAVLSGVKDRVQIRWDNFLRSDLKNADVVFAYLTTSQVRELEVRLEGQLKPGTRVVTISFDFPDWQPTTYDNEDLIFLYQMPPQSGNLESYLGQTRYNRITHPQ